MEASTVDACRVANKKEFDEFEMLKMYIIAYNPVPTEMELHKSHLFDLQVRCSALISKLENQWRLKQSGDDLMMLERLKISKIEIGLKFDSTSHACRQWSDQQQANRGMLDFTQIHRGFELPMSKTWRLREIDTGQIPGAGSSNGPDVVFARQNSWMPDNVPAICQPDEPLARNQSNSSTPQSLSDSRGAPGAGSTQNQTKDPQEAACGDTELVGLPPTEPEPPVKLTGNEDSMPPMATGPSDEAADKNAAVDERAEKSSSPTYDPDSSDCSEDELQLKVESDDKLSSDEEMREENAKPPPSELVGARKSVKDLIPSPEEPTSSKGVNTLNAVARAAAVAAKEQASPSNGLKLIGKRSCSSISSRQKKADPNAPKCAVRNSDDGVFVISSDSEDEDESDSAPSNPASSDHSQANKDIELETKNYYLDDSQYCGHVRCIICAKNVADITNHFKRAHPDSEVMISRFSPAALAKAKKEAKASVPMRGTFKCRFCPMQLSRLSKLMDHITSHTGEYNYRCMACKLTFPEKSFFMPHMLNKHKRLAGDKQIGKLEEFPKPRTPNFIPGYVCPVCNWVQLKKERVENHIRAHHGKELKVWVVNMVSYMQPKEVPSRPKRRKRS